MQYLQQKYLGYNNRSSIEVMPMRNKIKQFLESRGLSAYRMIQDTKISDTTGYKLAADPTYIPSSKILEALCEAYRIQPVPTLFSMFTAI